jgi:hypothetical protein
MSLVTWLGGVVEVSDRVGNVMRDMSGLAATCSAVKSSKIPNKHFQHQQPIPASSMSS